MKDYRVAVVVDREFGDQLIELASRVHVWACSSADNDRAAEKFRAKWPGVSLESGITIFSVQEDERPEEMLIGELSTVDLHHGDHSHDPAWTILEVLGANPTPAVEEELRGYGVTEVERTKRGFIARRPHIPRALETS